MASPLPEPTTSVAVAGAPLHRATHAPFAAVASNVTGPALPISPCETAGCAAGVSATAVAAPAATPVGAGATTEAAGAGGASRPAARGGGAMGATLAVQDNKTPAAPHTHGRITQALLRLSSLGAGPSSAPSGWEARLATGCTSDVRSLAARSLAARSLAARSLAARSLAARSLA